MGDGPVTKKTGLLTHQIQTWYDLERVWQNHIIRQIRTTFEARIAKERGNQAEMTTKYLNYEEVLRRKFRIELGPNKAESAGGVANEEEAIVDIVLLREPMGAPAYLEGTKREDGENGFITSM